MVLLKFLSTLTSVAQLQRAGEFWRASPFAAYIKRLLAPIALALLSAASQASADPIKLSFSEFAWGSDVADFYNGGRDSLNRQGGHNYGLSFSNGVVKYTPGGAYLSGNVSLTIDRAILRAVLGTDHYAISFNAGRFDVDGGPAVVTYEDGRTAPEVWIAGNGNPFCTPQTPDWCNSPHYSHMDGYVLPLWSIGNDGNTEVQATNIVFNTDRLDNIQIVGYNFATDPDTLRPPTIPGSEALGRDIPEPGSIALMGVGLSGLLTLRRKRKYFLVGT